MNKLSEIQKILNEQESSNFEEFNITILRNITIEPIEPYMKYFAYKSNYNCKIKYGDFDNIFQDAVGGNISLLNKNTDIVIVIINLNTLSPDLHQKFSSLDKNQVTTEIKRIFNFFNKILAGLIAQTDATIIWHSFELPTYPDLGILDSQNPNGQLNSIVKLNDMIRNELKDKSNAFFLDLNLCFNRIGSENYYDKRYWHLAKAPYSAEALYEIAHENFKFIRSFGGKNKKCVILDCDNTLWGGIIGEDGLAGIKLGKTYPGSAYYEFQEEIINLYNKGIIITICSKNNEEDVFDVFKNHPDMLLKEEHLTLSKVNWRDKASNIREIAKEVNIGLDSLVFIDDSEFETELIKKEIPEVSVIHLPGNEPIKYKELIQKCGFFDSILLTEEDQKRSKMYKMEAQRKALKSKASDLINFYKSLEMIVEISFADDISIPRIAQQTQKTNQFNLTTRRYSENDIQKKSISNKWDVFSLRLNDKFGDSGIVGTCIINYRDNNIVYIDSFLLSCRVIGRGVEYVFLSEILKMLKKKNIIEVLGEFISTDKNKQVKNFYIDNNFVNKNKNNFIFNMKNNEIKKIEYFKKIIGIKNK